MLCKEIDITKRFHEEIAISNAEIPEIYLFISVLCFHEHDKGIDIIKRFYEGNGYTKRLHEGIDITKRFCEGMDIIFKLWNVMIAC